MIFKTIPPKYAVSDVDGTNKKRVGIRLFKHVSEIRKEYWSRKFWPRDYFVNTKGLNSLLLIRFQPNI